MLGIVGGLGFLPLVFHRDTAVWFNEVFVHKEQPADLSNVWQVCKCMCLRGCGCVCVCVCSRVVEWRAADVLVLR